MDAGGGSGEVVVVKVVVEPGEDSGEKGLIIEEQKVKMEGHGDDSLAVAQNLEDAGWKKGGSDKQNKVPK